MTRLRILGTGNAQAVECYNTCLAIENENGTMIVDAGGGNGISTIFSSPMPIQTISLVFFGL